MDQHAQMSNKYVPGYSINNSLHATVAHVVFLYKVSEHMVQNSSKAQIIDPIWRLQKLAEIFPLLSILQPLPQLCPRFEGLPGTQ